MNQVVYTFVLGTVLTGAIVTSVGCTQHTILPQKEDPISLTVTPSSNKVPVDETVTFFTRTEHTLGHKLEFKWTTTGGSLKTIEPGSTAQVTFDKPGTYSVKVSLNADGKEVQQSTTVIIVSPINQ